MKNIKTYKDLFEYITTGDFSKRITLMQYYTSEPDAATIAFWQGVLEALEAARIIDEDTGFSIWYEITKDEHFKRFYNAERG